MMASYMKTSIKSRQGTIDDGTNVQKLQTVGDWPRFQLVKNTIAVTTGSPNHVDSVQSDSLGRFERAAFLRTEFTLRPNAERTGSAVPFALRNVLYAVTRLVNAHVATVTKHHLITVFAVRLTGEKTL